MKHGPISTGYEAFIPPLDWKKESEAIRRGGALLRKDKKTFLKFLESTGLYTKTGKIKKKYR